MMTEKPTYAEALEWKFSAIKNFSLPGTDLKKEADQAIAESILEADLGKHSDVQPVYNLDQQTRDRLLVHTRKDAAVALQFSCSLVDEVRSLRKTVDRFIVSVSLLIWMGLLAYYWKSGALMDLWHSLVPS